MSPDSKRLANGPGRAKVATQGPPVDVSMEEFVGEFGAEISVLPYTTCVLGYSDARRRWLFHGYFPSETARRGDRLDPLIRFLDRYVRSRLEVSRFWLFLNHTDGWREGAPYSAEYRWVAASSGIGSVRDWSLGPGEIPILSPSRTWVACYGAHRGDPSAVLMPEAHFLSRRYYRRQFLRLRVERSPWRSRLARAVFAGGDHGYPPEGETPRRLLTRLAAQGQLPLDVRLGEQMTRRSQLRYKYLLDVDGWVRTWDAWAWKLASDSVVLARASNWTTLFTEQFAPWRHFVPVAEDFSDLGEQITWCIEHDDEAQEIAHQARRRALEVYRPEHAGVLVAASLKDRLRND